MFNPNKLAERNEEAARKRREAEAVKQKCLALIPMEIQKGLIIDVKEVICGDPACAPIDTMVSLVWESGGKGMFAFPLAPHEVTDDDVVEQMPDQEVLAAWSRGEEAEWPPLPVWRFGVYERVECRIAADPVKGWAPGRIVALNYSQAGWPPGAMVPYQIWLHDGRLIFAPKDDDQVCFPFFVSVLPQSNSDQCTLPNTTHLLFLHVYARNTH